MSRQAQQARESLGTRLWEIRRASGITARALAKAAGWHESKPSKIQAGRQTPGEEDIRLWCEICNAQDQVDDLIATVRNIESMYIEWRRVTRTGLRRLQESSAPLYERTTLFRVYETTILPGLLQTPRYSEALLRPWVEYMDVPDDTPDAVTARMERRKVLHSGRRRFVFVLEEQTLRTVVGDYDVMREQLEYLLDAMGFARVSLGIIPSIGRRHAFIQGSFWIYDDSKVILETPTAEIEITQFREIALYERAFDLHKGAAVYGQVVRKLITNAMRDLEQAQASS